ncbi:MAG: glycosyltransferase family 4 protein [Bacteroidota bacterium]|jgi:glycosyltransferase involved in cell wall biosynthesis
MKLAFISLMEGFAWGGSEELWSKVANEALQNNNKVIINVLEWPEIHPKHKMLINKGAQFYFRKKIHSNNFILKVVSKIFPFISFKKKDTVWNWIENEKPDSICISMGGPYDCIYHPGLMYLIQNLNIPYFIIQQFNFENSVLNNQHRKAAKKIFEDCRKIFFVSNRNMETVKRNIVSKLENFEIVSNPINLKNSEIEPYPSVNDNFNFAVVARLDVYYKGQDMLIQTLASEVWKNRNWILNFYGSGPDIDYLEELILFYGLEKKVFLKGSSDDIREVWKSNHLLILPSFAEGTPLALIEAMHCGRTAVVTNVGGNAELIDDNVNGFIAESNNIKYLNHALNRAWDRRIEWADLGILARNKVLKKVDLNSHRKIYLELSGA